jgi:hypothetical protein
MLNCQRIQNADPLELEQPQVDGLMALKSCPSF